VTPRARAGATALAVAVTFVNTVSGCGGGHTNDDDTPPVQRTTVKWELNQDAARGFPGDACIDLGVSMMRVTLQGPLEPPTRTMDERCGLDQVVFLEVPNGGYTVALTPLDSSGASMVTEPVVLAFDVDGTDEVTVNVPYTAWNRPFTGSFLFHVMWDGQPCADASPPIVTQVLTMTIGGNPVAQTTSTGQRLDGTDPKPCVPSTNASPQLVTGLPLGPATLRVEGIPENGDSRVKQFETFVGAGAGNPTLSFDVPDDDDEEPDAPVDAPWDAAPPDA